MNFRKQTEFEIEFCKKKYGSSWEMDAFNNWMFNLPGGHYRHRANSKNRMDREFGGTADYPQKDVAYAWDGEEIVIAAGHSALKCGQTNRQFFSTIDDKLRENDISLDQIRKLNEQDPKHRSTVFELSLPAYLSLREGGYTWQDLCG